MKARALAAELVQMSPARRVGHVRTVASSHVLADGPFATIGALVRIETRSGSLLGEVSAVEKDHVVIVPFDANVGIDPDARVELLPALSRAPVGDAFCGRAIDALGQPIDGGVQIAAELMGEISGVVLSPLARAEPDSILETGVRAIDGLMPLGRGQRIGVFSASGVGKTTFIRQLAEQIACDHCVVCLVGERGREVEATWAALDARSDRARYSCVAATSDLSPSLRVRAAHQALCLAEYWRDQGKHVLLIVDSVTRFAMALREIGLGAGLPPTLRAYTPNVFSALPRLVERCGAAKQSGSITAIFTVLSETDEIDDPITEIMKSLLDGHIVLSRQLSEQGHFPPIDVMRSVSRQAQSIMSSAHATSSRRAISWLSAYDDAKIMIESGLYKSGGNLLLDDAMRRREGLLAFVRQRKDERAPLRATLAQLERIAGAGASHV